MTETTTAAPANIMRFINANIRDYALLLSLLAIMLFFQYTTNGTLFKPVNMTNLILQNSYIVIMALGMLLVIVAGHIDLSVGSVAGFVGAVAAVLMVNYKLDIFTSVILCRISRERIASCGKSNCNKLIEHLMSTPTGPG